MQRTWRYLAVFLLASSLCEAQSSGFHGDSSGPPSSSALTNGGPQFGRRRNREEEERERRIEREREKKANQDRIVKIKRDTDKLLALATELKEYVDKTNENLLSVDVIRKAEEIEKLAHSVREKMKD